MWAVMVLFLVGVSTNYGTWALPPLEEGEPLVRVQREQQPYGITHLDIRDAILTLEKSIKQLTNKLNRHEAREAQVATFVTSKITELDADHDLVERSTQAVARQLAKMEERLMSIEALIQTTDERQRMMLNRMAQGVDRAIISTDNIMIPPPPPPFGELPLIPPPLPALENPNNEEFDKNVKKMIKKLNNMDNTMQSEMQKVTGEVQLISEALNAQMEQMQSTQDRIFESMNICELNTMQTLQRMAQTQSGECTDGGNSGDVTAKLEELSRQYENQGSEIQHLEHETHRTLEQTMGLLRGLVDESHIGQRVINASVVELTRDLRNLDGTTQQGLGRLSSDVKAALKDSSDALSETVAEMASEIDTDTTSIMDTVLENHSELSDQIKSLKKVEKVMINTADAVLDTKRSIEYGIQQIILELGDIVKNSGQTINTTLSDQISNISFAILKNQTSALTNMTAKMEQEISQVWRQIGIMYQSMTQSVSLLDQLRNTTKAHMNVSLTRVGDMDGTVGQINTKVADVEENLNYLLGRLSLVVSEFNLMKSGVGDELLRLKENLARQNKDQVALPYGQQRQANRYEVSRRRRVASKRRIQEREALPPPSYFEQNREPITLF